MKWTVGLSVVLIALAGCATGYNKSGFLTGGGFSDTQLDENVFNITFRGNQYTSMERAKDFIYLRAADLTLKSGFTYFAITYATENVSTSSYTTASETTTQVNFYGNTADATSQTTPGTTFTKSRPSIEMTIICFAEKPNTNATVFNAKFLTRSVRQKYGMEEAQETTVQPTTPVSEAASATPQPPMQTPAQTAPQTPAQTDFFQLVRSGTPQRIRLAIGEGIDVNAVDAEYGRTALMWAAADNRNPAAITTLLKAGANINAKTDLGWTALVYAAKTNQNPEVITTLLKTGADAKAKDSYGKTAFDYAQDNKALEDTDALQQLQDASQ